MKCWLPAFSPLPKLCFVPFLKVLFCHLQMLLIWTSLKTCCLVRFNFVCFQDDVTVLQLAFNKGTENIIRVISGIGSSMVCISWDIISNKP